ncbi:MAG: LysR family transcriptional regulator, partial [Eubacteriales bacterium]
MYNPMLDTFIAVSDCGSFTKAAERLYISPTAVMKQMNALESHLKLKLTERTPSGVRLTRAGEVIYRDAKFMIDYSKKSVAAANAATHKYDTTFCVGTSLLNPAKPFMDLWYKVNKRFPDYKLHLVPFEDNHEGILSEIEKLGEKFDFL